MTISERSGVMDPFKRTWDFNGAGELLLIDKPLDWTSFDVVHRLRTLFGVRKAGHAGTLDPKATGLLILCTGKQTKNLAQYADLDKEYEGTFELGVRTPSYDSETEVIDRGEFSSVTLASLQSVARTFVGKQQQQPPMYSAVKYGGKPLYKYARKGRTLKRTAREVEIAQFEILAFNPPLAEFRVVCSKGTYVRSLVNDLGTILGCGAALRALRRTRIGSFHLADALSIEDLESLILDLTPPQENHEAGIPT